MTKSSVGDRLAELDSRAASRGWLGDPISLTMRDLWREMSDAPPGWIWLIALGLVVLLFISPVGAAGALAAVFTAWTGWAALSIRQRERRRRCGDKDPRWSPQSFAPGQRVRIATYAFYGEGGTLVRPTTLIGKNAWLVELDRSGAGPFALRRTRIVESALIPEAHAAAVLARPGRRKRATTRWTLTIVAPMFALWWLYFPWQIALGADLGIAAAYQITYWLTSMRRTERQ